MNRRSEPSLEIAEVDGLLQELSRTQGAGSQDKKHQILAGLFQRATESEQAFLRGLILRNLRQGALEGVMADAVATTLEVSAKRVRRAAMLEGDLVVVATRGILEGPHTLDEVKVRAFTPLQPMLAKTAESVAEAMKDGVLAVVEEKLDGLRLQVHRSGSEVRVYSRNLRDITAEMPEVVSGALAIDAQSFILDGEGLLIGRDGVPMSFQDSMSSRDDANPGLFSAFYFDALHVDGTDLIDMPLSERRKHLEQLVSGEEVVRSITTSDPAAGERFFEEAIAGGYEGVVVKDPDQPYAAGRRGSGWAKVKPTHTLDLVVLAAEWGSGRRQGWLSNLHLGARDSEGGYVMLGKTFKGLTDDMLAWQTDKFLSIEDRRDGRVVHLKPEVVYEIAFDGVQRSSRYPGGVALRFARVKRYREDKDPRDADTLGAVQSFLS